MSNVRNRFWAKVDMRGLDECWPWKTGRTGANYGAFKHAGKQHLAHRLAYTFAKGPIPADLWVLHKCDTPPCCNPRHLFLGTPKENTQDMLSKGRRPTVRLSQERRTALATWAKNNPEKVRRGQAHAMAKLTDDAVASIKRQLSTGRAQTDIAREFGCSKYTVSNIKTGKQWRHVQ